MIVRKGHNGICEYCGAITPCLEVECTEPKEHPYTCKDCLKKLRKRPHRSYMDTISSDVRFGY